MNFGKFTKLHPINHQISWIILDSQHEIQDEPQTSVVESVHMTHPGLSSQFSLFCPWISGFHPGFKYKKRKFSYPGVLNPG